MSVRVVGRGGEGSVAGGLGVAALEHIVGFFDRVFARHGSESIVLLYWDQKRRRYKLCVPPQEASVWESLSGRRSAMDVTYQVPIPAPNLKAALTGKTLTNAANVLTMK